MFTLSDINGGNVSVFCNDADDGIVEILNSSRMKNRYDIARGQSGTSYVSIHNKTVRSNIQIYRL